MIEDFLSELKTFVIRSVRQAEGNESKIVWEMNCLRKQNGPDLNCLPGNDYDISNQNTFLFA